MGALGAQAAALLPVRRSRHPEPGPRHLALGDGAGFAGPCTVVQGSMARVGAVAFIHRFGALLKPHLHFHCVVVDGLFEAGTEAELTARFHETPALSAKQLTDIRGKGQRPPHATRTHAARSARTGGRRGNGRLGSRR